MNTYGISCMERYDRWNHPADLSSHKIGQQMDQLMQKFLRQSYFWAYISAPFNGGRALYDTMERYGVKTVRALNVRDPRIIQKEVLEPNKKNSRMFYSVIQSRIRLRGSNIPVCNPLDIDMSNEGWTQRHYIQLWTRFANLHVIEFHFAEDFAYGFKTVDEAMKAVEMQEGLVSPVDRWYTCGFDDEKAFTSLRATKIYNASGKEMHAIHVLEEIEKARQDLIRRRFDTSFSDRIVNDLEFLAFH